MTETVESALRVPLFCDTALAGRIERVEAQLITLSNEAARHRTGSAGFVIPVAGGVASFAGEGSPYNKVAGLGFDGVPDAGTLDEIERWKRDWAFGNGDTQLKRRPLFRRRDVWNVDLY